MSLQQSVCTHHPGVKVVTGKGHDTSGVTYHKTEQLLRRLMDQHRLVISRVMEEHSPYGFGPLKVASSDR